MTKPYRKFYRKKPIEVEAYRFLAQSKEQRENLAATVRTGEKFQPGDYEPIPIYEDENGPCLFIQTKHGMIQVNNGDWLIRESDDSGWYPCKHEIFKATYDGPFMYGIEVPPPRCEQADCYNPAPGGGLCGYHLAKALGEE